jgi:hypothetical protein
MDDDLWNLDPMWAALAVECPRCAAERGRLCEDRPFTDDPRQTAIPGTGWPRREPHDERIAEWESRARELEKRGFWP